MNPPEALGGVLSVFQTPFHDDESIDFDTLTAEIAWLFDRGSDGVVAAMVSEVLRLSTDERRAVAECVCRAAAGRGPVVVSCGAESTRVAIELARHADDSGADAVMAIPPLAVAASEDELLRYYERMLDAVSLPLIVQDASGYVGRPMSTDLLARLYALCPQRMMFKPEAVPLGPRLTALHAATGGAARVFEGSGGIALVECHGRGVAGTMPGADLTVPLVALWRALEAGNLERAHAISLPLAALVAMQPSLDAFLAVEKYLLVKQGVLKNTVVRGPVGYRMDDPTRGEVDRLFAMLLDAVGT